METSVAKRYLKMSHGMEYDGYSFVSETEQLAIEVIELHKAIAAFIREEFENMNFENDMERINYVKSFMSEATDND